MRLLIAIVSILMLGNGAQAAEGKPVRAQLKEVKAASQQTEKTKLLDDLEKMTPQTTDDVLALVDELDGPLSPIVQKILAKTTNKDLAPALIDAVEKQSVGLKSLSETDFRKMGIEERKREVNRRIGLTALVETLGILGDRRAIGPLKKLLDDESLVYPASTALSRLANESEFNELISRMDQQRNINLAGITSGRLRKIVAEFDDPKASDKKKGALLNQIKGSRDPEVNRALKELALRHKDVDVRAQAGLALANSIAVDPSLGDPGFIMQWAGMETKDLQEDWAKGWIVYAIDKAWDDRYIPVLITFLIKNRASSTRSESARILGKHKAQEAVPYLEEAMKNDPDPNVRGFAWGALKDITGRTYMLHNPDDIKQRIEVLRLSPNMRGEGEVYPEEQSQ